MKSFSVKDIFNLNISPTEKLIFLALWNNAAKNATCQLKISELADMCSIKERHVYECLRKLEDLGYIERHSISGRQSTYLVYHKKVAKSTPAYGAGVHMVQGWGAYCAGVHLNYNHVDRVSFVNLLSGKPELTKESLKHTMKTDDKSSTKKVVKIKKEKRSQMPKDFEPDETHISLANEFGLDLAQEMEACRDHFAGAGKPMARWDSVLRNWLRNAAKFGKGKNNGQSYNEKRMDTLDRLTGRSYAPRSDQDDDFIEGFADRLD